MAPQANSSEAVNMSMWMDDNVTFAMEDVAMAANPSARYGHSAVVYEVCVCVCVCVCVVCVYVCGVCGVVC